MAYYTLDEDEQREFNEIEQALDEGTIESVDSPLERKRLQSIARNTMNKTRNINIRLSERDLHRLRTKAIEEGVPYQTLVSSILHKAAAH